mmetsp:Transcript_12388/g.18786  ORF Transcript_12388/g.18786 Transcript_12388/m.18786 type:complete len:244 (+) Transcript_12388:2-733(+)
MGSFRVLISSILYTIGSFLLLPGFLLFLPFGDDKAGILFFIFASIYLTLAGVLDFLYVVVFPRNTTASYQPKIASMFILLGGLLFLTASFLLWPSFGTFLKISCTALGVWMFCFGSMFYLCGSLATLYVVLHEEKTQWKYTSISSECESERSYADPLLTPTKHYIDAPHSSPPAHEEYSSKFLWVCVVSSFSMGSVTYIVGGAVSLLHWSETCLLLWCAGSIFFEVGAFLQLYVVVRGWNDDK